MQQSLPTRTVPQTRGADGGRPSAISSA